MSLAAFDGAAGAGKTFSVIEQLRAELRARPLAAHQRVLALTYMHGARHRLDEDLEKIEDLRGRYDALTLDSLAWRICRRWRGRVRALGLAIPKDDDFEANCDIARQLLVADEVRSWVAVAYPFVLVDEAQDLVTARLAILEALMDSCCVLLAFDEFQSLNSSNRPVAVMGWIKDKCTPVTLAGNRRTQVPDLIAAAQQIRSAAPLTASGSSFRVVSAPGKSAQPALAAAMVGVEILKGGSFALLTPTRDSSPYARGIVELLSTQAVGKAKNIGPFQIGWEGGVEVRAHELEKLVKATETYSLQSATTLLGSYEDVPAAIATLTTLRRARDAKGVTDFSSAMVLEIYNRHLTTMRQFTRRRHGGRRAMTIHQAKNREFDRVAVIWPFQVPKNADDRRRLLYNAITRARSSCVVIVQDAKLLDEPPFK